MTDAGNPHQALASQSDELARQIAERPQLERLFQFVLGHRVRYDEVAAQGVVSSGKWLDLLHHARVEYLRKLGLFLEGGSAPIQVMVRRATVEYLAAVRFDDTLVIRLRCAGLGNSHARFEAIVDNGDGLRVLVAELLVVCVEVANARAMAWPAIFRQRVQEFEGPAMEFGQLMR